MNKAEVIRQVSEKSGIASDVCRQVVDEFENQFGDILLKKITFKKNDRVDIAEKISQKSNIILPDCEKVLAAFEEVFADGLADKLKFWKK